MNITPSVVQLKHRVDQLPEFERYLKKTFVQREIGELRYRANAAELI